MSIANGPIGRAISGIIRQLTRHEKALEETKRLTVNAPFIAGRASLQTIAAGVISVTRPHVVVLPESGTADNLDEIENFSDGKFIVISTADVGDTITVRDESISGGNIALRGVTSRVLSDPEDSLLLIYKESVGFWIQAGGTPAGGVPALHASTHQHGGTDEVATATPAANAIPKAGGAGTLALGWIPAGGTPGAHAASHQDGGSDELLHQTLDGAGTNTHAQIDTHLADTSNPHAVTKAQVGLSNVTDDAQIPLTQKGAANGVAELDASSRLPIAQLPISVMEYKGTWDASTNTPTLADGTGSAGDVYRVSVAGTQDLGSGAIAFAVGDYVIYNGATWEKSDTTDAVASVNGATGVVVLDADNIGETATRVWFTPAEETKLAGIEALADVTDLANVGAAIVAASDGGAPQDTDEFAVNRGGTLTTLLWSGLKTALTTLFNGMYVALTGNQTVAGVKTFNDGLVLRRSSNGALLDLGNYTLVEAGTTLNQGFYRISDDATLFTCIQVGPTSTMFGGGVVGDTVRRIVMDVAGNIIWGDGANPRDTNLYRLAANWLKTDDTFESAVKVVTPAVQPPSASQLTLVGAGGEFGAKVLAGGGFTRFVNSGRGDVLFETMAVPAGLAAFQLQCTRPTGTTAVRGFWALLNVTGRIATVDHQGLFFFAVQDRNAASILYRPGPFNQNVTVTIVTQTTTDLTLKFEISSVTPGSTWTTLSAAIVAMGPVHASWTITGSQVA